MNGTRSKRCAKLMIDGQQCSRSAKPNQNHCWQHNKDKSIEIQITLAPRLLEGDNLNGSLNTGQPKVDRLIKERLIKDHTRIAHIFDYVEHIKNIKSYHFNPQTGLVQLILRTTDDTTPQDIPELKRNIEDEIENGADTWMEGDISIIDEDDLKKLKLTSIYPKDYYLEVGLDVIDIKFKSQ